MRRRSTITGVGLAAAIVTAGAVTAAVAGGTPEQHPEVVMAHGADRLPSTTAADWVTYADHVVVVTATAEKILPPTQTEVERGEGLLGRTVTLRVKDVLWSRDGAPAAPKRWKYHAVGLTFTEGKVDTPTPMALHDRPRIENGHQYVMAIVWEEARCSPGDTPQPARWMGLGEGSELPFDGGVIGQGEFEGRTQTVEQARALAVEAGPNRGLEERLAGQGAAALTAELAAATPSTKKQFRPSSTTRC